MTLFAGFMQTLETIEQKPTKFKWKWKTHGQQMVDGVLRWKKPTTKISQTLKSHIVYPPFVAVKQNATGSWPHGLHSSVSFLRVT